VEVNTQEVPLRCGSGLTTMTRPASTNGLRVNLATMVVATRGMRSCIAPHHWAATVPSISFMASGTMLMLAVDRVTSAMQYAMMTCVLMQVLLSALKKVSKAAPRIAAEVLARTRNLIVGQAVKMRDAHARRVRLNSPEKLSCGK